MDVSRCGPGAMVEYLLNKYSNGAFDVPAGTQQRADFLQVSVLHLSLQA